MWDVEATGAFAAWWRTLTEQEQDDAAALVALLAARGPKLPFPYSSGIEGSKFSQMRELRIQSHGDPIRILYAFDPRRVAVLLIGGMKSGKEKRFFEEFVQNADKLYEEHLKSVEG